MIGFVCAASATKNMMEKLKLKGEFGLELNIYSEKKLRLNHV